MRRFATNVSHCNEKMTLTIGIPALNEEKTISELLRALLKQRLDKVVLKEIIVNVSGSTDNTETHVKEMIKADSRIKLISGGKREGKASALNDILREARGDILLFIDGDVVLEKDAVLNLLEPFFQDEQVGVCSGNTMPLKQREDFFGFASLFIRSLHHEMCNYLMSMGLVPKVNGSFYAVRRDVLKSLPITVISDDEYASLLAQKKGYKIVYVPDALVYTEDPSSFGSFVEWQKRIISGQMYMKRDFNYEVPTMKASTVAYCWLKLWKRYRWKVFPMATLLLLGSISFIFAFVCYLRNEIPYVY
jgi:cellulose synthase/poly-beta-1,6-N-acetylglucosamine synthase-like glycosyltransferase